jgi:DNA-binding NtrC family response regulator
VGYASGRGDSERRRPLTEASTIRRDVGGIPIRRLSVTVVSGPDAGVSADVAMGPLRVGTAQTCDLRLRDATVSRFHLEIRRELDRVLLVDHDSTNGTQVGGALFRNTRAIVVPPVEVDIGATRLRISDGAFDAMPRTPPSFGQLESRAPAMSSLMASAHQIAGTDVSVLLLGESGTGKEVLARSIHGASARASHPIVAVDCAALTPGLFASEIFGHEKGAFTGADRRHVGAFERAAGGTVFLDEVAELPAELQAALLGVLERRRFLRVGGSQEVAADVRVLAATHRDMYAAVNAGRFRLDLFHRVAVVVLEVPPLRERITDLPLLLDRLVAELGYQGRAADLFDAATMEAMRKHPWPGNVRELRNFVHGTLALGAPPPLRFAGPKETNDVIGSVLEDQYKEAKDRIVETFERRYLTRLLERSRGNVREAARIANMNRSYLIELLAKHGFR